MTKEEAKQISEIFAAYAEGKTIQFYFEDSDEVDDCSGWTDVPSFDRINIDNIKNYRIKPEQKLRPYKDLEEFLNEQKKHGPYIDTESWPSLGLYTIPYSVNDSRVYWKAGYDLYSNWEELSHHVWQDGTPCGIVE